jgi:hypothetical protein
VKAGLKGKKLGFVQMPSTMKSELRDTVNSVFRSYSVDVDRYADDGSSLRVTAEGLSRADARLFAGEAVRRVASAAQGDQGEG